MLLQPGNRTHSHCAPDPRTPLAPAPPAPPAAAGPLLVAVHSVADLDTSLVQAAGRARAEGRSLLVAIVAPPHPPTVDAVVHQRHAWLQAQVRTALLTGVHRRCVDIPVRIADVRRPWGLTSARARRGLHRRLAALARRHGAEAHPRVDPMSTAPCATAGAAR